MEFDLDKWLSPDMQLRLVWVTVTIVILWLVLRFVRKVLGKRIADTDARYKTRKAATFTGYILSVVILVSAFSSKLSSLTVILGAAGVGVAFALQEVIASLAGWLAIMFREFYKVGDRVQLKGIVGDVIDIGLLRTTLMETGEWVKGDLYTGRIVKIANSSVFKEPVFNYNSDFPFLWDEVVIPIKFGSDYTLARNIFEKTANDIVGEFTKQSEATWDKMVRKYRIENAATKPMVTLILNDNWVEFTIRYITDYKTRRGTKDKIFSQILKEVEGTNDRIKFASATFELADAKELNIRVNQ